MIVDGHNDLVHRRAHGEPSQHVDLAAAAAAGWAGGFFALYLDSPEALPMGVPPYAVPLPAPLDPADAVAEAERLWTILEGLPVRLALRVDDFAPGHVSAIAHFEGAEPIASDLSNLEGWVARGLRSVGLVWSRANAFAEGVPFRFPSTPDTGPGLTAAGHDLVRACNRLGLLIDLSHLNEAGFWDVARTSDAPLVATHSNAHALCPSSRNLTDAQLDAVSASGGVVGVNFAVNFLRADGRGDPDTPRAEIVRHVLYLAERMGSEHVALGSDFDGATIPAELGGIQGLPALVDDLRAAGLSAEDLDRVTHGNWLRVLDATWR